MDVTNKDTLEVMNENILKCSIKELSGIQIGNWIVKYVYCKFIALKNLITTPVSNRLNTEQGVSECLNFSIVVEYRVPFTSF